jgi:tetratricopeptide (TPR) repeat protein
VPTSTNTATKSQWTNAQAITMAVASLIVGTSGGYLLRRSHPDPAGAAISRGPVGSPSAQSAAPAKNLDSAVDVQASAKLEQLEADPNNAGLLTELGNLYYDNQQYPRAIEYYNRVLLLQPANTNVRTDLGTAYWYLGDADAAIAEFNKSLSFDPTKVDTLFNLGIVQLKGKNDSATAIAAWQKLLSNNPSYEHRDQVQKLIAEAQASR